MPDVPDFSRHRRETMHALGLFAQCGGIEWGLLATVMAYTWERGLENGPVGRKQFMAHVKCRDSSLARCLHRLLWTEAAGGLHILQEVRSATPRGARCYRIRNWREWAWGYGDISQAKAILDRLYPTHAAAHPQNMPINPDAVALAQILHEHVRRTVDDDKIPQPDNPEDARWLRWVGATERILARYTPARARAVLAFALKHPFWREHLRDPNGAVRFENKIDTISGEYDAQPKPNLPRGLT